MAWPDLQKEKTLFSGGGVAGLRSVTNYMGKTEKKKLFKGERKKCISHCIPCFMLRGTSSYSGVICTNYINEVIIRRFYVSVWSKIVGTKVNNITGSWFHFCSLSCHIFHLTPYFSVRKLRPHFPLKYWCPSIRIHTIIPQYRKINIFRFWNLISP